jgi:flagellin-like protein
MINKRGISPVVATVLLIGIVIVAAVIIFIALFAWGGEVCMKDDELCSSVCDDVSFDVSTSAGGDVEVNNYGSVGIAKLKIKEDGELVDCLVEVSPGGSRTVSCEPGEFAIPVLEGVDDDGFTTYHVCDDIEESF